MITTTLPEKEQFLSSLPQFQFEPSGQNPFEAMPPTTVVSSKGSFEMNWIEHPIAIGVSKAEQILDEILSRSRADVVRFPSSAQVRANYALALLNRGNLDEAAEEFLAALKISPQHFMSLASLARVRTLQGRFNDAGEIYEELTRIYPTELLPLVNLSYVLFRIGNFDEAAETLKRAIQIDGDAALPRYLMAVSLLRLRRPHEAITHLRVAARTDVRSPAVYQALGIAYVMAGDTKSAVRSFRTALTLAPDLKEGVHALANVLFERRDTQELIGFLSPYLERRPEDIVAREMLSKAFVEEKNYGQARAQLTTALRYIVDDGESDRKLRAQILNNIGFCFHRQGDDDQAIHWIERSIAVHPTFGATPYLNLVRLHARRRQFGPSLRVLESGEKIFPENHEIREARIVLATSQEKYAEAFDLIRHEIATGEATANTYGFYLWYLTEYEGRPDEALRAASELYAKYPDAPNKINQIAYALLMSGRSEEARLVLMSSEREKKADPGIEGNVTLTATWGLLGLWEGDIESGRQYYELAARLALSSLQKNLPAMVQQKMHLEMAKAFLRNGDRVSAKAEIENGLEIQDGLSIYEKQLRSLSEQMSSAS
jgi:tetratricopeptide (TPR) repeat protein